MSDTNLKLCLVLHIKGKSNIPRHLQLQIETFMKDTVVPLMETLKTQAEEIDINLQIVDCDEADDITIHKCLQNIRFDKQKSKEIQ